MKTEYSRADRRWLAVLKHRRANVITTNIISILFLLFSIIISIFFVQHLDFMVIISTIFAISLVIIVAWTVRIIMAIVIWKNFVFYNSEHEEDPKIKESKNSIQ